MYTIYIIWVCVCIKHTEKSMKTQCSKNYKAQRFYKIEYTLTTISQIKKQNLTSTQKPLIPPSIHSHLLAKDNRYLDF